MKIKQQIESFTGLKDEDITKLYEEEKYLLKKEGGFLKWINEHLSVILNEIEISKSKKEREVVCVDLYKIQKIISRRIKRLNNKNNVNK